MFSPVSGINLISVRVENKTACAHFTRTETEAFDKIDVLRFKNAIRKITLQSPSVRSIKICLDGVSDFWLIGAKRHKKCAH